MSRYRNSRTTTGSHFSGFAKAAIAALAAITILVVIVLINSTPSPSTSGPSISIKATVPVQIPAPLATATDKVDGGCFDASGSVQQLHLENARPRLYAARQDGYCVASIDLSASTLASVFLANPSTSNKVSGVAVAIYDVIATDGKEQLMAFAYEPFASVPLAAMGPLNHVKMMVPKAVFFYVHPQGKFETSKVADLATLLATLAPTKVILMTSHIGIDSASRCSYQGYLPIVGADKELSGANCQVAQ